MTSIARTPSSNPLGLASPASLDRGMPAEQDATPYPHMTQWMVGGAAAAGLPTAAWFLKNPVLMLAADGSHYLPPTRSGTIGMAAAIGGIFALAGAVTGAVVYQDRTDKARGATQGSAH